MHVLKVAGGGWRDAVKSSEVSSQVRVHVLKVAGGGWRDMVKSCQVRVHVLKVADGVGEMRSSPARCRARCVCTC